MSKLTTFLQCCVLLLMSFGVQYGQEMLDLDKVLSDIKANNYDVKLAEQNIRYAAILTSKFNRGYRPTFGLNAGANYGINSQSFSYNFNLPDFSVNNAKNFSANISASANYLLYDSGQRKLQNEKNEANLELTELQVENLSQTLFFNASQLYYSIAQAMFNFNLLQSAIEESKERVRRAKINFDFGSGGKVEVLNAQVDVSRDSLNLLSVYTDIENLKWQLNQLTLREDINYKVDTTIVLTYEMFSVAALEEEMMLGNIELKTLRRNVELLVYDERIASKINSPTINANGAYNLNYQNNDQKSQLDFSRGSGLNVGLAANWNFVDGGQKRVQEQLAQVNKNSAEIDLNNKINELKIQLNRLWNNYKNNLLTMRLESQNINTTAVNFERVRELFNNGQQSSIEFRQAQLNMINAQSQYFNARAIAKLYEVEIDFLLGKLSFD